MLPAKWVLASASPRRREILSELGLKFGVDPSKSPEPAPYLGEQPARYASRIARLKVKDIGRRHRNAIVIGADTVVVVRGRVLGKPSSEAEARQMLRTLSGRWHEVITAVCLLDCSTGKSVSASDRSRVHFRRLSAPEIEWYLQTGEYMDKAGAYAIQGAASLFIDRIEGCYFNVVGFPIATFYRLCRRMGLPALQPGMATRPRKQ